MSLELLSPRERRRYSRALKRLPLVEEREALEDSLIKFFEAAWPVVDPAQLDLNWHHGAIAEHLEAVARGQIRKLLINIPPRHTKTLLASVIFPAWVWAQPLDPDNPMVGPQAKFLCLSYADNLVMDNATYAHRLVTSGWYQARWGDRVKIAKDQDAKNKFDTTLGGTRISAPFNGTITGRGGDYKIMDDPHKVDEAESQVTREKVLRVYDGTLKSRLTDPRTAAEILVMQRLHENDLAGHILDSDDDFVHLNLPAEYDNTRHCVTVTLPGKNERWQDPRTEDGELLWPQRFGPKELAPYKRNPYEWSGQWQQLPVPRGGGLFPREWWQLWEPADGKFPPCDLILASLDGAFTAKEENDPSGFTAWGIFSPKSLLQTPAGMIEAEQSPRVILMDAWRKHLKIHGTEVDFTPEEEAGLRSTDEAVRKTFQKIYEERAKPHWGLVEWVAYSCRRFKVDTLLIEAKASGISVAQEMRRLYADEQWNVVEVDPKGDKVARALSVVPAFSRSLVYAPDREWANLVIDEMASFPKGRYDDLTDSATQAIKYLRERSLVQHPEERQAADLRRSRYRPKLKKLYPF